MACHRGPSRGSETNANLPEHSAGKTSPPLDCPIRELVANVNRSSHTHSHSSGRKPCHSGQVICHAEFCVSFLVAMGFLLRRMAAAAEKMVAALSIPLTFAVYEPKVRLMNQCGRLGRPLRLLVRQRSGGEVRCRPASGVDRQRPTALVFQFFSSVCCSLARVLSSFM